MSEKIMEDSRTRNSPFRKNIRAVIEPVAGFLADHKVTANEVTIAGGVVGIAGAVLARKGNNKVESFAIMSAGALADAIDGSVAREWAKRGKPTDGDTGQKLDAGIDRIVGVVRAIVRAGAAKDRDNKYGEIAAITSAVTISLPSLARAVAEKRGKSVPEMEKGLLILGTHAPRTPAEIAATAIPEIQPFLDTAISVSNVAVALKRMKIAFNTNDKSDLTAEEIKKGKGRLGFLAGITALSMISVGVYLFSRENSR
jgi:phosphatidylglycerophosphate synthase